MEKDIGRIEKNDTTDIVVRVDDFGGRVGLTIREFVTSDRYTGFTKAGVRISSDDFSKFKEMINSIDETELEKVSQELKKSQEQEKDSEKKEISKGQETLDKSVKEKPEQKKSEKSDGKEKVAGKNERVPTEDEEIENNKDSEKAKEKFPDY